MAFLDLPTGVSTFNCLAVDFYEMGFNCIYYFYFTDCLLQDHSSHPSPDHQELKYQRQMYSNFIVTRL